MGVLWKTAKSLLGVIASTFLARRDTGVGKQHTDGRI